MAQQAEPMCGPPPQLTRLVGRERELAELQALLADPTCRLLTLAGPGGIGKTRLATELAAHALRADSAVFVALQAVTSEDGLVAAIAAAVGAQLTSQAAPREQLLRALRQRRLLLVLDNFEQLTDAAQLLVELLAAAPAVTLLVTSREVLNLHEEWVYRLDGLEVPADASDQALRQSAAAQLFLERARRARHDFALDREREAVVRICALTEGLPLALELAASWVRTLPGHVIAAEIERNLAFLHTSLRNLPERHRNVRATFDHSWHLLSERERAVFARLAVFRGGFTREAAEQVAAANLPILATLLDKSLLRVDAQGRYQIHELLRQYAEEQLHATPQIAEKVRADHASYFLRLLHEQFAALVGGQQRAASVAILTELDNVRAAVPHALDVAAGEVLRRALQALRLFYTYCGPYAEGTRLLTGLASALRERSATPDHRALLADLLVGLGWLSFPAGELVAAGALFDESEALYRSLGVPPPAGIATDPLIGRALLALYQGAYAEAAQLGTAARLRSEAQGHEHNLAYAWFVLTNVTFSQGVFQAAREAAAQAYAGAERTRDHWLQGFCLCNLGDVSYALGDYAEARRCYEASFVLRKGFNDPQMARPLVLLGRTALAEGQYAEAFDLYQRSLRIYEQAGDHVNLAWAHAGLGRVAVSQGDYAAAQQIFADVLTRVAEMRYRSALPSLLTNISELLAHTGRVEIGTELLVLVLRDPANDRLTSDHAQNLLLRCESLLDPERFVAATERGQRSTLETVVPRLLQELAVAGPALSAAPRAAAPPADEVVASSVDVAAAPAAAVFDVEARELVVDGVRVGLSHLEFNVLHYLAERAGKAVPRGDLLEDVWGYSYEGGSNVVDVVVRALRKKLGAHAALIETVTKVGYRFRRP